MAKIFTKMQSQPGVLSANINTKDATVSIALDPRFTGVRDLANVVSSMGFSAVPKFCQAGDDILGDPERQEDEASVWTRLFAMSLIFTLPVFLIHMVFMPLGWFPWLMEPAFFEADVATASEHAGHMGTTVGHMERMTEMHEGSFSIADLLSLSLIHI